MNHRFEMLKAEIFARSHEKTDWDKAILEWKGIGVNLPGVPKAGKFYVLKKLRTSTC
jgi:hypothetical protein